jgi:predicted transposase/invertase (TIGR01784 family)
MIKQFLETHSAEVLNMLMTEWNLEDALVVEREEGREEGWEKGLEQGREKGLEQGRGERDIEVAKNALKEGASLEFIQKITGLNIETIKNISAE